MKSYDYVNVREGSIWNLADMLAKADAHDWSEGCEAYHRYHALLWDIAHWFASITTPERTVAAFVALSPNNDYVGNLRSLITLLKGVEEKVPLEQINTSTYRHCLKRAHAYVTGEADFLETVKGPKIRAFYKNIVHPLDPQPVTVDGHMVCCWLGKNLPMKKALLRGDKAYETVAQGIRDLAGYHKLIPNQLQSILWFTRKRVARVRYVSQMDIFDHAEANVWRVNINPRHIKPFDRRP